jgi:hypothetical protein
MYECICYVRREDDSIEVVLGHGEILFDNGNHYNSGIEWMVT